MEEKQKKLVSFDYKKANGIICVWDSDTGNEVTKKTSKSDFIVPSYLITGLFDDGSIIIAGIEYLELVNIHSAKDRLFSHNHLLEYVNIFTAERLVEHQTAYNGHDTKTAKEYVFEKLQNAHVEISDDAKKFLTA